MKLMNRAGPLAVFFALILFSQVSDAIIISSYTALYKDGSKLVVDLKEHDYGEGAYYASSTSWNEPPHPPVQGFDAYFYPSAHLQNTLPGVFSGPGKLSETLHLDNGLYFEVDKYSGASMTSFLYLFFAEDWGLSNNSIFFAYGNYDVEFSDGFFETYMSPYQLDGPGSLALMIIGIAGLGWVRLYRQA
ncbi:hypothetical protein [Marinobacter sp. ANT_B65]|uniref:hypothetical protein n=1 Tax=Marinobacter sp. ANT_B65 TaxID=2039467 RepID=UPI000BBED9F4|nr:hypothetical protein [Marinobacter sp. ANT_B65]PCM43107.1 hypothetical protein CPA50_16260 [Marinobacter sp. ANT_B65]